MFAIEYTHLHIRENIWIHSWSIYYSFYFIYITINDGVHQILLAAEMLKASKLLTYIFTNKYNSKLRSI
jgi:hypothetical protein